MKTKLALLCSLLLLFAGGAVLGAESDPYNLRIIQRDASGNTSNIDILGSLHPGKALVFDSLGVLGPVDIATQLELDAVSSTLAAALALKANLNSPALTGTPTTPTATGGTNTTQIASTAFVTAAVAAEAATRGTADTTEASTRAAADTAEAAARVAADAQKADIEHTHNSVEILDMTDVGRQVIRASTLEALKALLSATTTGFSVRQRVRIASGSSQALMLQRLDTGYWLECTDDSDSSKFAIGFNGSDAYLSWFDGTTQVTRPLVGGAMLTSGSSLNASNLGSGTVPDARFPATLPAASGVNLTALNASNLASGTVPNARLDTDLQVLAGITYNADIQALLAAVDYAAFRVLLGLGTTQTPVFLGANLGSGILTHSGGVTVSSYAITGGVIDVTKRLGTLTLSGTTTTLTLSAVPATGREISFELTGSGSGENVVTLDLSPDMISMDTRLGQGVTQFTVPASPARVRCTLRYDGTNYLFYNDPGMNTGIASIPTARTTYVDTAETTVASASTTDLGAVASDHVSITGTTTITSFGTCAAGVERSGVFTGALTLTHNATSLICPWGANITTVAGATFRAVSLGSGNWRVYQYTDPTVRGTVDADTVTLKLYSDVTFGTPSQCDNTGAVRVTTEGVNYGHATFSNSADKAGNYVIYRGWIVPTDIDTSVDLTAIFTQKLGGADTGKQAYEISMADVASSASADAPTFSNAVAINFAGDGSGASTDLEISSAVTLTSWRSSITAGHALVIKLARDGDDGTNDTSTVNSNDYSLQIRYKRTQ